MENPYTTAPLNLGDREIRLVKLEPSSEHEPIKCSLQAYILDDECPEYVALSYTWGAKGRHDDIQLNGVSYPVRRSLWSFLDQMRRRQRYIPFWIDAISINQNDMSERNHQVQIMRQIYSKARSVWVWLGEADETTHSNIAMQYLATRKPLHNMNLNLGISWSAAKARAMLALCERMYWKRIWIIQEIMLAKHARILCGNRQVDWERLSEFMDDLRAVLERNGAIRITGVSDILESTAAGIVRAKSQWSKSPQTLASLLELYRDQKSTDLRDKVYALHGLAHDSDVIKIDYNIDPKDLLVDMIYYACRSNAPGSTLIFAKSMNDILKVYRPESELTAQISVAQQVLGLQDSEMRFLRERTERYLDSTRARLHRERLACSVDNEDAKDRVALLLRINEELSTRIKRTQYEGIFCTRGPERRFMTAREVMKEFDDGKNYSEMKEFDDDKDWSEMYDHLPIRPVWKIDVYI
jgi:hypothetical protein